MVKSTKKKRMKLFLSAILPFIVHIFAVSAIDELAPAQNPCLMKDDETAAIICVSSSGDMVQESSNHCRLPDTSRSCYSSLDCAMQKAQQEPENPTIICLNPGNYTLNVNITFENFDSGISIIGNSTREPLIHCSLGTGFTFFNSSNILLNNLNISGCGSIHNSINLNVTMNSSTNQTIPYHVGIYVSFCTNVTLRKVSLHRSRGIGLALYDTVGSVMILGCIFNHSDQYENYNLGGGGGMSIEFSNCIPGPTACSNSIEERTKNYTSNSAYIIENSVFKHNRAYRYGNTLYKITNHLKDSYNLGNGAGISLVLKGNATSNHFIIRNCSFMSNHAHYGGGFYFAFFDDSYNNNIKMLNCNLTKNKNFDSFISKFDIDASGGGGLILFTSGSQGKNNVSISDSIFERNKGISGGALSIHAISNYNTLSGSLNLTNNTFYNNSAYLGSAINFFRDNFMDTHYDLDIGLKDLNFSTNIPLCITSGKWTFSAVPCTAIVYTSNQRLYLSGTITFSYNKGICFKGYFASFVVENGAVLEFSNNIGDIGVGFSLYDCSYIKIGKNTSFLFDSNYARQYGGAIYSAPCTVGMVQLATLSTFCFLSYHDISVHPDNWNTSIVFYNNTAELDLTDNPDHISDIHADTLTSCWWPETPGSHLVIPSNTFCWTTFHFNNSSCKQSVDSGLQYIEYPQESSGKFPGESLSVPHLYNGKNITIYKASNFQACVALDENQSNENKGSVLGSFLKDDCSQNGHCSNFNTLDPLSVYYCGNCSNNKIQTNSSVYITLSTSEQLQLKIHIEFKDCQWPYTIEKNCSYCTLNAEWPCCGKETICDYQSSCQINSWLTPKLSYCVSNYIGINSSDYIVGHCPISYSNLSNHFKFKQLSDGHTSLEFCNSTRTGMLCGECKDNLSLPINSLYFECVNCTGKLIKGWFILIACQFVPHTLLVLIIAVFNIKLTIGIVTGFVIYCQILSVELPGWYYPPWLSLNDGTHVGNESISFAITSTYAFFNMNFLAFFTFTYPWNVCLTNNMTALAVISFGYIVAFYPLLLTALLFAWVALYDKGILPIVKLTIPLHKCLARFWRYFGIEPSLIQTAASIFILSYMQLLAVSLKLLRFTSWQSLMHKDVNGVSFFYDASMRYFGWPHAFFGLFAIVIIIFFVALPIIFLLFYQCSWFHKLLDCLKLRHQFCIMIGDIFTGPFKDGSKNRVDFRYMSGLYLLFRVVAMCLFYINNTQYILYSEISLSLLFSAFIMIFRPFRKTLVNFAEFIAFFNLGLMSGLCLAFKDNGRKACLYAIMHIPTILLILYVIVLLMRRGKKYWILARKKAKDVRSKFTTNFSDSDTNSECHSDAYDNDSDYNEVPDRVLNPSKYSEKHVPYSPDASLRPTTRSVHLPSFASSINSRGGNLYGATKNSDSDYGSSK